MADYAELASDLEALQAAIAAAQLAQANTQRGRSITRAELRDLYAERRQIRRDMVAAGYNTAATVGRYVEPAV